MIKVFNGILAVDNSSQIGYIFSIIELINNIRGGLQEVICPEAIVLQEQGRAGI